MDNSDSDDVHEEEYEMYGRTPPRTRILRKNKDRRFKDSNGGSPGKPLVNGQPKVTVKRNLSRRNTVTIMFDELITKADEEAKERDTQANPASKGSKRSLKLLRGSERDLKLNIPTQHVTFTSTDDGTDPTMQNGVPLTPQSRQVETCKRFICLSSKRVYCADDKAPPGGSTQLRHSNSMNRHQLRPRGGPLLTDFPHHSHHGAQGSQLAARGMTTSSRSRPSTWDVDFKNYNDSMQSRANYYQMLTAMLTQGGVCRSSVGSSASSVQGEQPKTAAQRHLSREEDMWQSELKDLIWLDLRAWLAGRTLSEEDDYICRERAGVSKLIHDIMNYRFERGRSLRAGAGGDVTPGDSSDSGLETEECTGCNSLFCRTCMDAQNKALVEVEDLMSRLEKAEALFPSSCAFGAHYPDYNSCSFSGRVKAMCLWYNMTRHQRLKLVILSRLLALVQSKYYPWPFIAGCDGGAPYDSMDGEGAGVTSPSDSNSSTGSGFGGGGVMDFSGAAELLNIATSRLIPNTKVSAGADKVSPYRKYIENILKTRGLNQSMSFLERIHTHVLSKAQHTLEKPNPDIFHKYIPLKAEEELQRYGSWSPEAKSLNLPSYNSLFLFLSRVPLEVVYEFLRMRLEQKPTNPSPLSVRQLMRELKEGLRIATQQREKIVLYLSTLIDCCSKEDQKRSLQNSKYTILRTFDEALREVFRDYLGYIEQWSLMDHGVCQTNLLEEEWKFIQEVVPHISEGCSMACSKFCIILGEMLVAIGKRLIGGIEELEEVLKTLEGDNRKQNLFTIFRELQYLFREERETCMKTISFSKFIFKTDNICINTDDEFKFREAVLSLKCTIPEAIERTEKLCDLADLDSLDEADKISLMSRCREILIQGFRLSFDFHQHLSEFISSEHRGRMARSMLHFVILWTKFMSRHYAASTSTPIYNCGTPNTPSSAVSTLSSSSSTGRKRPLWMQHSLDFLLTACDIRYTAHLTEAEFSELRRNMDECIKHLVGAGCGENRGNNGAESGYSTASTWGSGTTPDPLTSAIPTPTSTTRFPTSRNNSPVRRSPYRSQRSSISNSSNTPLPLRRISGDFNHQQSIPSSGNSSTNVSPVASDIRLDFGLSPLAFPSTTLSKKVQGNITEVDGVSLPTATVNSFGRIKLAVDSLDQSLDQKLANQGLIGRVVEKEPSEKGPVKRRLVKFTWQRGTKIGQGRFGKVYTAVNNDTGELMAVKEIALQRNDAHAMQKVADELKIMEGISHRNLVKYFGLEVHKEEMLIFMEFCAEGTLESLVATTKDGLPELLIRRYTYQLLNGIQMLHSHGIVHRDIKTANIFLTDGGNCLKIGDFGCAAKLKSHVTVAGELHGFYGTQAYMAPEMFVSSKVEGHGRAVDIWSVGCVVVEMASGQRPWAEFDANLQIMYKVGNGERPIVPDDLIEEGHDFLSKCFEYYPRDRATVVELLDHSFVKAGDDDSLE